MESYSNQADEAVVFNSASNTDVDTCSLVLSAKNIGHRISRHTDGTSVILVPAGSAEAAAYQLNCFFQENRNWPPPDRTAGTRPTASAPPTLMLIGGLALFYAVTGPWSHTSRWFANGAGNATAILEQGEWYRLVTALTLHADLSHLLGNCLIGGFLLHFFLQINGIGLGLLAVLITAALGNYLNVMVHGSNHLFVGFSTAVFSVVGMLAVHQIFEQRNPFGIRMLVPLMAGAALLAMLGSSGVRTDLGAHLFGLLAGMLGGLILGLGPVRAVKQSQFIQTCLFLSAVCVLLVCWNMALSPRAG